MRDHGAWHQCFLRFSGVFPSGFWLLSVAQSTGAPCLGGGSMLGTHTWGPRAAAHRRHRAHCPLRSILAHRAAPLCSAAEDLNDGHLKCLFLVFDAPFQDALWKLLINGQILALKLVSLE